MLDVGSCEAKYSLNLFLFFFKQKTAYEMRISDWSSDVCSSDLFHGLARFASPDAVAVDGRTLQAQHILIATGAGPIPLGIPGEELVSTSDRSEEHTSELQSLMRISYAVFCLKKKNIANK